MYTVYLITAIVFVASLSWSWNDVRTYNNRSYYYDQVNPFVFVFKVTAVATIVAFLISGAVVTFTSPYRTESKMVETKRFDIYELNRGVGVYGRFVLGTGEVDSVPAWSYSTKQLEGDHPDVVTQAEGRMLYKKEVPGLAQGYVVISILEDRNVPLKPSPWRITIGTDWLPVVDVSRKCENWQFYIPPGSSFRTQ